MGASPILVPNPTSRKTNAARSHAGCRVSVRARRSGSRSEAPPDPPPSTWEVARKKVPSSASAIPTEQTSRYFHTASSER
jgi:hypothetical protein